jgi:nucleoside-diphosphate-sugar epimerase
VRILVTGATGFIGAGLIARLAHQGRVIRAATRRDAMGGQPGVEQLVVGDFTGDTEWAPALEGVNTVVHLAGRVHVMRDRSVDPLGEFRRVNVDAALRLARVAAEAGARRFVYLSTIKVNGESGVFREADPPSPRDPYAVSKYEAELGLRQISVEAGLEVVIIRPPLVYGPGVRASFLALMRAVARGIPLPFGAVKNRRSMIARDNLVDFIVTCVDHPHAANETFLVSDGNDLSTPELVRRIARAMGRPARIFSISPSLIQAAAGLLGQREVAQRLLGSLQVDISKARQMLGWIPPVSVDVALHATTESFHRRTALNGEQHTREKNEGDA